MSHEKHLVLIEGSVVGQLEVTCKIIFCVKSESSHRIQETAEKWVQNFWRIRKRNFTKLKHQDWWLNGACRSTYGECCEILKRRNFSPRRVFRIKNLPRLFLLLSNFFVFFLRGGGGVICKFFFAKVKQKSWRDLCHICIQWHKIHES